MESSPISFTLTFFMCALLDLLSLFFGPPVTHSYCTHTSVSCFIHVTLPQILLLQRQHVGSCLPPYHSLCGNRTLGESTFEHTVARMNGSLPVSPTDLSRTSQEANTHAHTHTHPWGNGLNLHTTNRPTKFCM